MVGSHLGVGQDFDKWFVLTCPGQDAVMAMVISFVSVSRPVGGVGLDDQFHTAIYPAAVLGVVIGDGIV